MKNIDLLRNVVDAYLVRSLDQVLNPRDSICSYKGAQYVDSSSMIVAHNSRVSQTLHKSRNFASHVAPTMTGLNTFLELSKIPSFAAAQFQSKDGMRSFRWRLMTWQ